MLVGGVTVLVSERIQQYMKLKGIHTNTQLSKLSGVPLTTLQDILREKRDPRVETIKAIAKGLGVKPSEFFEYMDEENNEVLAAHRDDDGNGELPEEAIKSIEDFKKFIHAQYNKKK